MLSRQYEATQIHGWCTQIMNTTNILAVLTLAALYDLVGCGGGSNRGSAAVTAMGSGITSEADAILHMDQVRAAGYRGAGIRVGVISTGVVNLASYQNARVLPTTLYVSQNYPGKLDEGSWMLELIHQHAPDAELGFCDGLDLDFNGCIKDLAENFHADIIVDDLLFSGQFYPDSSASLITQLETANERLVFIHLAGNEQNGGYWQGAFAETVIQLAGNSARVLDFGVASGVASGASSDPYNSVIVPAGRHLILLLNWNDPPHGAANHILSAYLLDEQNLTLSHASAQSDPNLRLDYVNSTAKDQTIRLVVAVDGSAPVNGLVVQITEGSPTCNIECQPLHYFSSGLAGGTIGDLADVLVVGATNALHPRTLEPWSNHGPFRIDFSASPDVSSPDGSDYMRLATPLQIEKPDLVAPDCVTVPFSNGVALTNEMFCGTSAAVPAIAGAAALLESAGFNRIRVLKSLRSTAAPQGAARWDPGYGLGLADVAAAWRSGGNGV